MSESDKSPDMRRPPVLTEAARTLLRRALKGEQLSEDEAGFAELAALRVLCPEPYRQGIYVLAERSDIEDHLRGAAEERLTSAAKFMSGIRTFLEDIDRERSRFDIGDSSRASYFIDTINSVHEVMASLTYAAQSEILALQPGKRKRHILTSSEPRDIANMQRGIAMRTIYQRINLPVPHVRRYVANLTAAGAQFRTTDAPLIKTVLIDGRDAFIPDVVSGRDSVAGAWHIRDPAAVGYIRQAFEYEWLRASPWDETGIPSEPEEGDEGDNEEPTGPRPITTPRQRTILRGICDGQSYQQIGRMLGVKSRTVADDMARLRRMKNVETNEQLAYWFATSPDRLEMD